MVKILQDTAPQPQPFLFFSRVQVRPQGGTALLSMETILTSLLLSQQEPPIGLELIVMDRYGNFAIADWYSNAPEVLSPDFRVWGENVEADDITHWALLPEPSLS